MKRAWICWLTLTAMTLGLVACGNDATTPTPVSQTTAATNTNITIAPNQALGVPPPTPSAAKGGNPIVATINANTGNSGNSQPQPTATPTVAVPTPTSLATDVLPVYSGFKPLNFGTLGSQISQQYSRSGANIKTEVYSTGDDFAKVSDFYNSELAKLNFTRVGASDLPASTLLPGKVLLYGKGSGNSLQGLIILGIGPLDADTIAALSTSAPDVVTLKPGSTVVLIISGLTGNYLSQLQKELTTVGTGTPVPTR